MASVYKPKGRTRYHIAYTNADGIRKTVAGYRDKEATKAKAREIETQIDREKQGLAQPSTINLNQPVIPIIRAYLHDLKRKGCSEPHVYNERGFLTRLMQACEWRTLRSITPASLTTYLIHLSDAGRGARTQNAYRASAVAFCNWCVEQGHLLENPITRVAKVADRAERRPRRRRAFTLKEFLKLASVHPDRGTIYQILGLSGLRKEELAQVTAADFEGLNSKRPLWTLRGEIQKSKRFEKLPMLLECAERLLKVRRNGINQPLFPQMPRLRTLNRDLKKCGIAKRDSTNRTVDFHSFRYFFCTLLARQLPIQVVKTLMRHRDIRTTVNLYMDLGLEDIATDLLRLPKLLDQPTNGVNQSGDSNDQ